VRGETVSNRTKRKLLRVSELDEQSQTYTMSAYLIAQLGRNFAPDLDEKIIANRFQPFDTRRICSSEEKHELVQFLRLL
jgi:hypothetical protein